MPDDDNVIRGRFPPLRYTSTMPGSQGPLVPPDGLRQIYQRGGLQRPSRARTWDVVLDQAVRSYIEMLQNYIDSMGPDIPPKIRYGCFKSAVSAAFTGLAPGHKPLDLRQDAQLIATAAYEHAAVVLAREGTDWSNRDVAINAMATIIEQVTEPPKPPTG